ncbi:hypothetical protein HYQ63_07895 [Streptomyces sp. Rer75]|nr:hypothetical protein HYQ63_07895 [Streptomyces sp. Rer75]
MSANSQTAPQGPALDDAAARSLVCAIAHGINRLAWLDRPTGAVIRRYERDRPGGLIHVDEKAVTSADLLSRAAAFFRAHGTHRARPRSRCLSERDCCVCAGQA